MKDVKLIDILPTFFGVIALIAALDRGLWSAVNLGPMMLYGGTGVTLFTAFLSVSNAKRTRHAFSKIHYLNFGWLALAVLFFAGFILFLYEWSRVRWTF